MLRLKSHCMSERIEIYDTPLRDGNAEYLSRAFGDHDSYSILFRVPIIDQRVVVTPDWTAPGTVLHTWSEKTT